MIPRITRIRNQEAPGRHVVFNPSWNSMEERGAGEQRPLHTREGVSLRFFSYNFPSGSGGIAMVVDASFGSKGVNRVGGAVLPGQGCQMMGASADQGLRHFSERLISSSIERICRHPDASRPLTTTSTVGCVTVVGVPATAAVVGAGLACVLRAGGCVCRSIARSRRRLG